MTIVDSDATTEVPLGMQETRQENSYDVSQQRALCVRFDEAMRMHSFAGSQYIGRVMDKECQFSNRLWMRKTKKEEWTSVMFSVFAKFILSWVYRCCTSL